MREEKIHSKSLINCERANQYKDRQISSNWTSAKSPAMPSCSFQEQAQVFDTTIVIPIQYGKDPQSKRLERWEPCKATKKCSGASKTFGSWKLVAQIGEAKQERLSCSVSVCGARAKERKRGLKKEGIKPFRTLQLFIDARGCLYVSP